MLRYIVKRSLIALPVIFITVTICFFLMRLAPGGPFTGERPLNAEVMANLEAHYNLDKPLIAQYGLYMLNLIQGDLGPSFANKDYSVNEIIGRSLPYTLILGSVALILSTVVGCVFGIFAALKKNQWPDSTLIFIAMLGLLMPNFLMASVLQYIFGLELGWLPVGGWGTGSAYYLALPVVVLGWSNAAKVARLMRGSMIETLGQNYIRTARAKGIGEKMVIIRHVLRAAFMPVLSYLGPAASFLLTGSLVVERAFGLPGVGRYFVDAALNRDYGMVLGTVVFYVLLIVMLNLLVDIAYALLDPRIRSSQ